MLKKHPKFIFLALQINSLENKIQVSLVIRGGYVPRIKVPRITKPRISSPMVVHKYTNTGIGSLKKVEYWATNKRNRG
jgi:hypothetical protein